MGDSINIFVCGDIVNLIGNDAFIGQNLAEEINHADFAIGNLEGAEFKVEQEFQNVQLKQQVLLVISLRSVLT